MPTKSELEAAYRATCYQVFLPGGMIELKVGEIAPRFAAWLAAEGIDRWAILTACNPRSERLSAEANAERQSALEVALLERGFEPYAGENIAPAADWPTESSCLVPNISLSEALGFAQQFEQNAILHGNADGAPSLVWADDNNSQGE